MKRLAFISILAILFMACNNNESTSNTAAPSADAPVVKFEKDIFDFGIITDGESVSHEFKFKNVGKSPLIISDASATCGCTVPEYPTKPIKPGESGIIKIVFNSTGKVGLQDKVVSIISNANPSLATVHVVGEVKEKQ
ncbi:MAG: DUF1573 domain-containing protein [Pedobacter sp.]|nr:MAG: DUF1573 domain-containing protein [Pedobacter sp.]